MDENKCKVYLLSGFLGSGKTTLLKHLLETHPENERVAVLMNEFGKAGVDGDVVRKNGLEIIEISRGSIFCACAKGDFLRGLYTILKDYRPTVLLVEASGVADTTDMKKDLGHGMLHDYYRFAGNICVIDAEHFEDWLDLFNAVIKQTEAATQLIINKTDLVTPEAADALERHLHELNPAAKITRASFGNVPWSLFRSDEADEKMAEIPEAEAWEKFIDDVLANATPHMAPPDNLASLSVFWEGDRGKIQGNPEQTAGGRRPFKRLLRRHGRQMEGVRHRRQQKPGVHGRLSGVQPAAQPRDIHPQGARAPRNPGTFPGRGAEAARAEVLAKPRAAAQI